MADHGESGSDACPDSRHAREPPTREEWERLPADPDLHDDLGYDILDLEGYETEEGGVLFLPKDEDMLRDEAFIVVRKEDVNQPLE